MHQHVGWIRVNSKGAGPLQIFHSVASGLQCDSECAFAARRKHVPDTVTHNNAVIDANVQAFGSGYKDVRGRLSFFHIIAGENLDGARQVEVLEQEAGLRLPSGGCNCHTNMMAGEMIEQLIRPRKGAEAGNGTPENGVMPLLETIKVEVSFPVGQFAE